jgi:DNA-binding NtrC family response regulator
MKTSATRKKVQCSRRRRRDHAGSVETLLSAEGYRVDLAKTGEEGLEYGRRAFGNECCLMSMPGIGGLRALEEFEDGSEAVIVMITAYATFDTAIAALGARGFRLFASHFKRTDHRHDCRGNQATSKEEERRTLRRAMSKAVDRGHRWSIRCDAGSVSAR